MEKNSIIDNQVENDQCNCAGPCIGAESCRKNNITASTAGQRKLAEGDYGRMRWTKEDPMVTELRTGIHPEYGLSPIKCLVDGLPVSGLSEEKRKELQEEFRKYGTLASQNSFKLAFPNLTDEEIKKRIVGQFEYAKQVMRSGYSLERKKELVISAVGGAVNFALGIGRLDIYLFLGEQLVKHNISLWEQK